MERVRSIGMMTSGKTKEIRPSGGRQRPRSLLERARSSNQDDYRSPCITWKNPQNRKSPDAAARKPRHARLSDVETLAAAAFALGLRVLEFEGLVQALFDKIHQGPVDQRQARGIDHYLHAARFKNRVFGMDFISIIHDIRESRAAGLLDADAQAQARSALRQVRSNPISRRFRQQYRHATLPSKVRPKVRPLRYT